MSDWESNIQDLYAFAHNRGKFFRRQVLGARFYSLPIVMSTDESRIFLDDDETTVTLRGFRLVEGTEVWFDGVRSPRVEQVDGELPASPKGLRALIPFDTPVLRE